MILKMMNNMLLEKASGYENAGVRHDIFLMVKKGDSILIN